MPGYIFTFGRAYDLADNYCTVEAANQDDARERFVEARADVGIFNDTSHRWAFVYPAESPRTQAMIERHGLTEVPVDTPINWRDADNPVE